MIGARRGLRARLEQFLEWLAPSADEPESYGDRRRRERLELDLERHYPTGGQSLEEERRTELRRLALLVVCAWTDEQVSDAEYQAQVEELADYLMRTAL